MVNCQADHPGAGIFRPVCDTLQNEGDASFRQSNGSASTAGVYRLPAKKRNVPLSID